MPEVELPPEFQEALEDTSPEVDETPSNDVDDTTPGETPPEESAEAPVEEAPETPSEHVAADEPVTDDVAPDEPKAKKTTEWNSLQKEAKGLGINIRGMKKDDVQRLVEEGSSRLEAARDTARRLYRTSEEWLEGKSADEIDAALVAADNEYAARQQQQQQKQQDPLQQPAPQPAPEVTPEPPPVETPSSAVNDILAQTGEYYDPEDPLVQAVIGIDQKNQELLQRQQEMMSRYEAMENHLAKQHNDEMTRRFTSDFVESLNSVGMPEIFGTDSEMTPAQRVQTQHVYNTVTGMLENNSRPGWTVADYVNSVVRAGYGPEINAIKQRQMESIARDQSSTRLGGTGNVSRQEHVPNGTGHITEDQELHALFNEMQKQNGT